MHIGLRALGLTGSLLVALYSGQPIHEWLTRVQAGYDQAAKQRKLVAIATNFTAMQSALAKIMATVLAETPSFSRVRVATIHNQIATDMATPLVSDAIATLAAPGHAPGELTVNVPITQLSDYLGTLLKQECVYVPVATISEVSVMERMQSLGVQAFLACPILNQTGDLLGVIYGNWDSMADVPDNIEPIKNRLKKAGRKIGSTVELVN